MEEQCDSNASNEVLQSDDLYLSCLLLLSLIGLRHALKDSAVHGGLFLVKSRLFSFQLFEECAHVPAFDRPPAQHKAAKTNSSLVLLLKSKQPKQHWPFSTGKPNLQSKQVAQALAVGKLTRHIITMPPADMAEHQVYRGPSPSSPETLVVKQFVSMYYIGV